MTEGYLSPQPTGSKLQVAKIVGISSETSWSQVHAFVPPEEFKKKKYGSLIAVLSISSQKEDLEIASFGTEIIQRLHEHYFSGEKEILENLKISLLKIEEEFGELLDLNLAAAVIIEEPTTVVYLSALGADVWLYRGEELIKILEAKEKVKTASGYLKPNDRLILTTAEFSQKIPLGSFQAALATSEIKVVEEELAALVNAREENSQLAAALFTFQPVSIPYLEKTEKKRIFDFRQFLKDWLIKIKEKKVNHQRRRQVQLIFALVVLIFLILSLARGYQRRHQLLSERSEETILQQISIKYDEALNLNQQNPTQAKTLIKEASEALKKWQEENQSSPQVEEWQKKLEITWQELSKEFKVEPEIFLELKLIKEGFEAEKMDLSDQEAFLLDPQGLTLIGLNLETKAGTIIFGGEKLKGSQGLAAGKKAVFVANQEKLLAISTSGKVISEQEIRDLGEIKDMVGFAGNAYLLGKEQIFKFPANEANLQNKVDYLIKSEPRLKEAVSLAIDGSVWVLLKNGEILKFTRGLKDSFVLQGLDKPLFEPLILFTNENCENLYLLERKETRLLVIDKKGNYQRSYFWSGLAGVKDFVVLEDLKKAFLNTGQRIYQISLN